MALVQLVSPEDYEKHVLRLRVNDPACLAPAFRQRSADALADCQTQGLDVVRFETCRSDELAKLYFAHGASKAPDARYTWHFYGLAMDVISQSRGWDVYPDQNGAGGDLYWYSAVATTFKKYGLDWGGDWLHFRDYPHWQFGGLRPTPLDAVRIYREEGREAVWKAVGALAA